jgi:hypothetical protein
MERVFIVGASCGDYYSHDVWVCGVYLTRKEAEAAWNDAVQRKAAWRSWHNRRYEVGDGAGPDDPDALMVWMGKAREAQEVWAAEEPPQEQGDYFYLREVPVGQWGIFHIALGPLSCWPRPNSEDGQP